MVVRRVEGPHAAVREEDAHEALAAYTRAALEHPDRPPDVAPLKAALAQLDTMRDKLASQPASTETAADERALVTPAKDLVQPLLSRHQLARFASEQQRARGAGAARRALIASMKVLQEGGDRELAAQAKRLAAHIAWLDGKIAQVSGELHAARKAIKHNSTDTLVARLEYAEHTVTLTGALPTNNRGDRLSLADQLTALTELRAALSEAHTALNAPYDAILGEVHAALTALGVPVVTGNDRKALLTNLERLASVLGLAPVVDDGHASVAQMQQRSVAFLQQAMPVLFGVYALVTTLVDGPPVLAKAGAGRPLGALLSHALCDLSRALAKPVEQATIRELAAAVREERFPKHADIERLAKQRSVYRRADDRALRALAANGPLNRATLKAIAQDGNAPFPTIDTARKVLRSPQLSRALFNEDGVITMVALDAIAKRLDSAHATDRALPLHMFYADAHSDTTRLRLLLTLAAREERSRMPFTANEYAGKVEAFLRSRTIEQVQWLAVEYEGRFGEGSFIADLAKAFKGDELGLMLGYLRRVPRAESLRRVRQLYNSPPPRLDPDKLALGSIEAQYALFAKKWDKFLFRIAGTRPSEARLAELKRAIEQSKDAARAWREAKAAGARIEQQDALAERLFRSVVEAEELAMILQTAALQATDRAMAITQASIEFSKMILVSAAATIVAIKSAGVGATAGAKLASSSWLRFGAALARAGTATIGGAAGGGLVGGFVSIAEQKQRGNVDWSRVKKDMRAGAATGAAAGLTSGVGLVGGAAVAKVFNQGSLSSRLAQVSTLAGLNGVASYASVHVRDAIDVDGGDATARATEFGTRAAASTAVLGLLGIKNVNLTGAGSGVALNAVEQMTVNAIMKRDLTEGLAEAVVNGAVMAKVFQSVAPPSVGGNAQPSRLSRHGDAFKAAIGNASAKIGKLVAPVVKRLPQDLSLTLSGGVAIGIDDAAAAGPGMLIRINGADAQARHGRSGFELSLSPVGVSTPFVSARVGVIAGQEGTPARSSWARSFSLLGVSVTTDKIMGARYFSLQVPLRFSLSLTEAGGIGGSLMLGVPGLKGGVGMYVDHPSAAKFIRPVFFAYDIVTFPAFYIYSRVARRGAKRSATPAPEAAAGSEPR